MMKYQQDRIRAKDESIITLTFYAHASVGIEWKGIHLYIDPVGEKYGVDYATESKADLIFITHHHLDHFDRSAIQLLSQKETVIYGSIKCMENGETVRVLTPYLTQEQQGVRFYAVPAYNISPEHLKYHPKTDGGLGYVLSFAGTTIYFAGDTEDNDDILSLQDIDIAFLPINQPYTMTIKQTANVAKAIHPTILYPYHYGSALSVTDVFPLLDELNDVCEVRIRNLE